MDQLKHIDAVVLCGGLGTRLQGVLPGRQKVVAEVGNQPFLGILLDRIFKEGIGRAVLCVGHLKEQVTHYIRHEESKHPEWGEIVFSEEDTPLGTGGAVKNAEAKIAGDQFFVLNGDTLAEVPLRELHDFHRAKDSMVTIAAVPSTDRSDVGSIDAGSDARILGFRERAEQRAGLVNAGTYLMRREALGHMPSGIFSIEKDFFPKIAASHACYAFVMAGDVLDIGTPERYNRAKQLFA
jgi:D-glycero-alpha-D-manno-heptose 1-phosphate guanylyltransferase